MPVSIELTPRGCTLWLGATDHGKLVAKRGGKIVIIDRWMWEQHHDVKLPPRAYLWRACEEKKCIHPWHGAPLEGANARHYTEGWGITKRQTRGLARVLWAMKDPRASLSGLLEGLSWDLEDVPQLSCHPDALGRLERLLGASKHELLLAWGMCLRRRRDEIRKGSINRAWDLDKTDKATLEVLQSLRS